MHDQAELRHQPNNDALLFAIAQCPNRALTIHDLRAALDDATGYELEEEQLEQLARQVLQNWPSSS